MSLFDKFKPLAEARKRLQSAGEEPFGMVTQEILSPTEGLFNGKPTILVGTNNYLGLTFAPECIEAACEALRKAGTGTTGSRMANGTYAGHAMLETELAEFYGCPVAIVFSTGYVANLGMLSTLTGSEDVLLLDADCHASIYDGCRMSDAQVMRFRHNDAADLDKRLRRLGDKARNTLVVVEGIYSMMGDKAPLAAIVDVVQRHQAYVMVDEAHSLGVLGHTGQGLAEEQGVSDQVDFIAGTFSKSLAGIGGFCVSRHAELESIRFASRPYVFTASPSPATIATTRVALRRLQAAQDLRAQLKRNGDQLFYGLKNLGFAVGPEPSPVVAVILNNPEQALASWHQLLHRGIYVNLVLPPGAPNGASLLRCSVSAAHTPDQIDQVLSEFARLTDIRPA